MPKYLLQVSYTAEGLRGLQKDGASARLKVASQVTEAVGGKVEAMYFAFGEHDIVAIVDVPSPVDIAAIAFTSSASGMLRTVTTPLLSVAEADEALKKKLPWRAPGG